MTTQTQSKSCNIKQLQKAYQADQQLKYMSLQTKLDILLEQIKTGKVK